ncbi:hypothetical protein BST61_g1371 [Cercospora zeina]
MALPTRIEFIRHLQPEQCDICYDDLVQPTFTPCGHFYCLGCLITWLQMENTCPGCRRKLFEPDTDEEDSEDEEYSDFEDDGEAQEEGQTEEGNEARGGDENQGAAELQGDVGADTNGSDEAADDISQEEHTECFAVEVVARLVELDTGMQRLQPIPDSNTATFDSDAMSNLMAALRFESRAWSELNSELGDWDVMYTFVSDNNDSSDWKFDHISYDASTDPDLAISIVREQGVACAMRHAQWTQRLALFLGSMGSKGLSREFESVIET